MNCKEIEGLLLSYLDEEVDPEGREAIESHLSGCPQCRAELESLARTVGDVRNGLTDIAMDTAVSPYAWNRLNDRLQKDQRRRIAFPCLRGIFNGLGRIDLGGYAAWERATVSVVLIGAMVVGLLAVFSSSSDPSPIDMSRPLGPLQVSGRLEVNPLRAFASQEELEEFVETGPTLERGYKMEPGDSFLGATANSLDILQSFSQYSDSYNLVMDSIEFSETNVQVEGVDESDVVKTDGKYIYAVVDQRVNIIDAYPAEGAEVLSEIPLNGDIHGLYIRDNRLVVLETRSSDISYDGEDYLWAYNIKGIYKTYAMVYDVIDRSNPVLLQEIGVDGQYWNSRKIGDYIYFVVEEPSIDIGNEVSIPSIYLDDIVQETSAEEILHPEEYAYSAQFITVVSFNMMEQVQSAEYLGYGMFLLDSNTNLYASLDNLYITCNEYNPEPQYSETTVIHRIHFDDGKMVYDASGEIPGRLLNQFSMDEYQGYFRVATTTGYVSWSSDAITSWNHIYILDDGLDIVGSLEDLAPGEKIYSARFMSDRCYLVTFKQVDPFFVIDLSDPVTPEVLGELKITGYSDYLHPYDQDHIIGIGKETEDGLYQGVKISLFEVADVNNPKEVGKYVIGDRGTDSPVLNDHKALLFDREKNLLVIPVLIAEIDQGTYSSDIPSWAYGEYVWQGACVIDISTEEGVNLRGQITHYDEGYDSEGDTSLSIERSLYIGDVLYTISNAQIKMNDMQSLSVINSADLS
ncbi:MAG: beta-propeller domain-containing protein [Chloroflexota bacterium]|nr:beta-propeller domain-containing protein [Chloroflexota bacterium]